jgi:hypothetical protein
MTETSCPCGEVHELSARVRAAYEAEKYGWERSAGGRVG